MPNHPLAPWCALGKASLAMGQQWQDAAAAIMTSMLKTQLDLIDTRQSITSLHGWTDLYHGLAGDFAAQQQNLLKAVSARAGSCVDDLRRAGTRDDMAIVLNGFLQDVRERVKENTEAAFTLLNSAQAASVVLAHEALDGIIAADGALAAGYAPGADLGDVSDLSATIDERQAARQPGEQYERQT